VGDFIIRTGDLVSIVIDPPAIVPQLEVPMPLEGSAETILVNGTPACVLGDEMPAELMEPMPYTAPPFIVPGMGTLMLTLLPDNMTVQTMADGPLLIRGGPFIAMFTVEDPAMQPTPAGPIPDPVLEKPGTAEFITTNMTVIAS
jgi:Contractile injection system spike tip protein